MVFLLFILFFSITINGAEKNIKSRTFDDEIAELSENNKKLFDIMVEIRLVQDSCKNLGSYHLIPTHLKGMDLSQLHTRQKELISQMKKLASEIDDNQLAKVHSLVQSYMKSVSEKICLRSSF